MFAEKKERFLKICRVLFVLAIFGFLLAGLLRTLFFPKEVNSYESRFAYTVQPLTAESFMSGGFQDGMENALSDQVLFSQHLKRLFHLLKYRYQSVFLLPEVKRNPTRYFDYGGLSLYDGYIVCRYAVFRVPDEGMLTLADARRADIERCLIENPDTDFYLYYIDSDHDLNLETGAKSDCFELLCPLMALPEDHVARLCLNNAEDYESCYFKTDHHWNCYGTYRGYREILQLLAPEETPLEPLEAAAQPLTWAGSKSADIGFREYREPFELLRYDYPEMRFTAGGASFEVLGVQDTFFTDRPETISFTSAYGPLLGELIVDTDQTERENALVIGDSFLCPLRKLIAAHFNRTCYVDLRYFEEDTGAPFDLSAYVAEHGIDKVLYVGGQLSFRGIED